jgi:peptide methionine sulfoxide reductase MsrB
MRGSRPLTKPLIDRWCAYCEKVAPSYATKSGYCVECLRKYNRKWREKNREYMREYYQRRGKARGRSLEARQNTSRYRKKRRRTDAAYREREVVANRAQKLKRAYGLTLADYDAMHAAQKGLCAICGEPSNSQKLGRMRALAVDHDHLTNKVRELLCHHCNSGLGHFKDQPSVLWRAILYLLKHGKIDDKLRGEIEGFSVGDFFTEVIGAR